MYKYNLLEETIEILGENNKTVKDILWCGTKDIYFEWEDFKSVANEDYNSGYGAQEVAGDLLIVGENWWLERHDYDGSEWWEFKESIQKPKVKRTPDKLTGGMWDSLATINKWED